MKALIFDTETTGLTQSRLVALDKQPEIIELYAEYIDLDTGECLGSFDSLFKPSKPLDDQTRKITHIDDSQLADAPSFADRAERIQHVFEHAPLVIAHNAAFDREMLEIEFERLGVVPALPRFLCTVEQTLHLKGYRLKLNDMHEMLFGEKFKDAHRAKTDTQALIKCCCELRKRGVL